MIEASRCPSCQRVSVPPEDRCLACAAEPELVEIDERGEVLTCTRWEDWVGLVELAGGARVLVRFPAEPAIGDRVELGEADVVQS